MRPAGVPEQGPLIGPYRPGTRLCSPFDEQGDLTQWAKTAIDKGIGLQLNPYVTPYPGNVGETSEEHSRPFKHRARLSRKDKRMADRAARLIGGWGRVETSSPVKYASAEELAQALFVNDQEHPRYAEALAATMMLYPQLKALYPAWR